MEELKERFLNKIKKHKAKFHWCLSTTDFYQTLPILFGNTGTYLILIQHLQGYSEKNQL